MIDHDYITTIRASVPFPALYEQLAEECTELAHAALKMARVMRAENPTPVSLDRALSNLYEEASDVHTVAKILNLRPDPHIVTEKLKRWYDRIEQEDKP